MLARALAIAVAFELALYLWLGARIAEAQGAGIALVWILFVALAWRAGVVAITYLIAFLTPGRGAGIAPVGPARMTIEFVREVVAFTALFAALQLFVKWTMGPPARAYGPDGGRPLLLVHGYLCNRGFWFALARSLGKSGYRVHTIDLEPPFGSIDGFARQLDARIDAVRRTSPHRQLTLVGHSMGGLVIRACLRDRHGEGIAGAVTLGSPHDGTSLAGLGLGRDAREMRRGSPWLGALANVEHGSLAVPVVSIYSGQDNFVSPQRSAHLESAENVPLPGVGHLAMAFSARVRARLLDALARIEAAPRERAEA
jgi:pimeloyl-ACP methyl ester carboxylesterase